VGRARRLPEEKRIEIEGISATSAGAMNATVLAYGFATGGRDEARAALAAFWRRLSLIAMTSPLNESWLDCAFGNQSHRFAPAFLALDLVTLLFPGESNPLNLNPLKDVREASIDVEALRESEHPIKLFLSAANVRTGKVKVFERHKIGVEHVLASGCLPFMFQAVEIDGERGAATRSAPAGETTSARSARSSATRTWPRAGCSMASATTVSFSCATRFFRTGFSLISCSVMSPPWS
jgi:predicted acylesterase/phospholipase RssA